MKLNTPFIVATHFIQYLLEQVKNRAHFNYLLANKLSSYCCNESLKYGSITVNQNYRQPQTQYKCLIQNQPVALIQDNFFPSAASIDEPKKPQQGRKKIQQKKDKKLIRHNSQASASQISQVKKITKKQQQQNVYEKLDLPQPQQQQPILKQLRKKGLQQQNQAKQKDKNKQSKPKNKEGKQGKQEKIGFDYTGEAIKIRSQNRNSLISGCLSGQTLKTVQKLKQVNKNPQVTQIQNLKKDKKFLKVAKNSQIQFTDTKTLLSEVKVTKGIKLSENGRIMEQKKKIIPVKQLMKTLSGKRLTKQDYKKIKQLTGNVAHFDDLHNQSKTLNSITSQNKVQAQQSLYQLRSASQSKLSNSNLSKRKSVITVGDPQLLQDLIQSSKNQATYKIPNQSQNKQQQKLQNSVRFDSNDHYNIQYMRRGGSLQTIKKSNSTSNLADIKLPKIQNGKQEMPRIRERLKDKQQIVRAIRRKFQQKLRT